MSRKKIVAGNWKMNLNLQEAERLFDEINGTKSEHCDVYAFVPSLYLIPLLSTQKNSVILGAQNAYFEDKGAFTGEISMSQLASIGVKAVLVGHSERRSIFGEDNQLLREKVNAALKHGLRVFFCCGETLEEREKGNEEKVILEQLSAALFHLSPTDFKNIVIAYEPVWAIGTGKTASDEQANAIHEFIRKQIALKFNEETANNVAILYGGSCNPTNAKGLFNQPHIDGGLIGGASLKSEDFKSIQQAL